MDRNCMCVCLSVYSWNFVRNLNRISCENGMRAQLYSATNSTISLLTLFNLLLPSLRTFSNKAVFIKLCSLCRSASTHFYHFFKTDSMTHFHRIMDICLSRCLYSITLGQLLSDLLVKKGFFTFGRSKKLFLPILLKIVAL